MDNAGHKEVLSYNPMDTLVEKEAEELFGLIPHGANVGA